VKCAFAHRVKETFIRDSKERAPRMRNSIFILSYCMACLAGCMTGHHKQDTTELHRQMMETERAFAKTMADRDSAAFATFISDEAVFFSGPSPLRGKKQVTDWWKRYYEKKEAPFSWEPDQIEVLDSGTLALSTGPVYDPKGRKIATFTSIWRREAPGV
jgi:ketosteroid isomerase-like protein